MPLISFFGGQATADPPQVTTNSIGMTLALIPAGEYVMGAEQDPSETLNQFPYCDPKWLAGELPRHRVRITKSFYLARCEVTLGQFLTFCHDAAYKVEIERDGKPSWGYDPNGQTLIESPYFRPWAPGWRAGLDHPVVYVSWNDAVAFCEWLSKKESKVYRLPTEAEWEYACRAGSNRRYSFGDDPEDLIRHANAADVDRKLVSGPATITSFESKANQPEATMAFPFLSRRDGYAWTAPVGKYLPNAFGLNDMHGNVWEWCSDFCDERYYETSPAADPQGPADGTTFVLRGGGFTNTPASLRCSNRVSDKPSSRGFDVGFRVAQER